MFKAIWEGNLCEFLILQINLEEFASCVFLLLRDLISNTYEKKTFMITVLEIMCWKALCETSKQTLKKACAMNNLSIMMLF